MAAYSFNPSYTQLISLTTVGSAGISASTGSGMQGTELSNLSTNNCFGEFFLTSTGVATLPTTAAIAPGFCLPAGAKNQRFVCNPGAFLSMLTTGVGLTAIISVTAGQFM